MNERIKELRKILNMTQKEFSEKIFLKQAILSELEKNKVKITDRTIDSICEKYNVNREWLTTGEGEMFKKTERALTALEQEIVQMAKLLTEKQQMFVLDLIAIILKNNF